MRRYLVLEEETETAWLPEWYVLIQAAKYIGCKPWELLEQSVYWTDVALKSMKAESQAREILNNRPH